MWAARSRISKGVGARWKQLPAGKQEGGGWEGPAGKPGRGNGRGGKPCPAQLRADQRPAQGRGSGLGRAGTGSRAAHRGPGLGSAFVTNTLWS